MSNLSVGSKSNFIGSSAAVKYQTMQGCVHFAKEGPITVALLWQMTADGWCFPETTGVNLLIYG